jgi:hypothetical protein
LPAISSLAAVRQANDRIEATLPDLEIDHRSRPGPKQPVDLVTANVEYGETGMLAALELVARFRFSSRLFSGRAANRLEYLLPRKVTLLDREVVAVLCLRAMKEKIEAQACEAAYSEQV